MSIQLPQNRSSTFFRRSNTMTPHVKNNNIRQNKEYVCLIWFDSTINTNDDSKKTLEMLRAINDFFLYFIESTSCIEYIKSIDKETIFLIVSGKNAYELLPKIISYSQVDTVFIFCANRNKYQRLLEDFPKVVDVLDNCNNLFESINQNIKLVNKQMSVFCFYDRRQQATRDLSKELAEFLWFLMFKDVTQKLPRNDQAKNEMVKACKEYYRGNHKLLALIDEFEQTYHSDHCIRWYTKETFLYKLINKALRTEDIEQLYTFRFYIADLSAQLSREHQKIRQGIDRKVHLYRGLKLSKTEVDRLQTNEGQLVATNGYLSTSRSREYALTFANKLINSVDDVKVLYEIECDLDQLNDSIVFADISEFSEMPEELEVLFDLGSTFKIENVFEKEEDSSPVWIVRMAATGEGRDIVNEFLEHNRKEMELEFKSVPIMFSILLRRMGESKKSLRYLQQLLKAPGNENVAHIHAGIGVAFKDMGDYDQALWHFDRAYELTVNSNQSDQIYSITVLHNKGLIYAKKRQYGKALNMLTDALDKLIRERGPTHCDVATFDARIGRIYIHMNRVNKALECQQNALEIRKQCLPANHPAIAFSLADIAYIYQRKGDFTTALKYQFEALELRREVLPAEHYTIGWSLHIIGQLYAAKSDFDLALEYYQKSLQLFEKLDFFQGNSQLRQILKNMAIVFDTRKDFKNALECRFKMLENIKKIVHVNNRELIQCINDIVFTLEVLGDLKRALTYRLDVLNIRKMHPYADQWVLTRDLNDIAYDYEQINENELALNCYYNVMENCRYLVAPHHPFRQSVSQSIRRVKERMRYNK